MSISKKEEELGFEGQTVEDSHYGNPFTGEQETASEVVLWLKNGEKIVKTETGYSHRRKKAGQNSDNTDSWMPISDPILTFEDVVKLKRKFG